MVVRISTLQVVPNTHTPPPPCKLSFTPNTICLSSALYCWLVLGCALASIRWWHALPNSNTHTGMFVWEGGGVTRDKSLLDHLFVFFAWWSRLLSSQLVFLVCFVLSSVWIFVVNYSPLWIENVVVLSVKTHFKAFSHTLAVINALELVILVGMS